MEHALAVHLEESFEEIEIEDTEPRDGLDEFRQTADEARLPESVEEGALGTGHTEVDALALDHAGAQPATVARMELRRIGKEKDPNVSKDEGPSPPSRQNGADVPVGVGGTEELERRVVREQGVVANSRGNEVTIRLKRPAVDGRRNRRVDAAGNDLQPAASDVVLDAFAGGLSGVGSSDRLRQIVEPEHRTAWK